MRGGGRAAPVADPDDEGAVGPSASVEEDAGDGRRVGDNDGVVAAPARAVQRPRGRGEGGAHVHVGDVAVDGEDLGRQVGPEVACHRVELSAAAIVKSQVKNTDGP